MNSALLLTYAFTVFLLIATPGPVVALVINTAARVGPRQAMLTALGTNGASLMLIVLAASVILTSKVIAPHVLSALSLLGCLFIGYLGITTVRQALTSARCDELAATRPGGFCKGLVVGLSNPKDILFFVAFFPQFIQVTADTRHSLLLLSLVWIVIDMTILGLYILITLKLATPRQHRLISLTSGVALLVIAVMGLFYNLSAFWN
ncbi:LysE family translocator [Pseudomonas alkylphenolica]|uniref:LysE family translocator n=1 Tax=Pseudomonas alkylphenolica TaxID=237609 RepID=A0A443ZJY7_9PSED|nr:LysE family translocator [Pseudomonas alkylphenolica]RWU19201.1 LysE family translocator [Pseudomonas alkylphenolica]